MACEREEVSLAEVEPVARSSSACLTIAISSTALATATWLASGVRVGVGEGVGLGIGLGLGLWLGSGLGLWLGSGLG